MKNLFLIGSAILALGAVSCKKDNSSQSPAETVAKMKSWIDDGGVTNYTYDASGRLTNYEHVGGSKSTYEYQNGLVVYKLFSANGNLFNAKNLELDASGYVIHEADPGGQGTPSTRVYNAEHQLVKNVFMTGNFANSMDYFYTNGNCDSMRYTTNGQWGQTVKWTYYTDKGNSLSYKNQGMPFWGVSSKNLTKTEQYFYPGGSNGDISNFTYEFDAGGNVIKQTIAQGANISISYISYY